VAASAFVGSPLRWLAIKVGYPLQLSGVSTLVGVFVATWLMLRSIDRRSWADIDLSNPAASRRKLLTGWSVGALAIGIPCAVLAATGLLQFVPAPGNVSWLAAALRTTLVLIPASLGEELMLRGYLLTIVRETVGTRAAVIGTSVIFGLLHLANPGSTATSLIVVMLAGVFLATVRLALNSLWAAWMAHLAWNFMMAVVLHASVSGIEFQSPFYKAVSTGPVWLSGGEWGPEGGLVAALGLIGGLAYFYYTRPRREES
jgi:membrane protease YdiL (CAAX protease family)